MQNFQNIRRQGGFTLIELMIVIAIVAILAAIAIPAYQDYTVRSRVSECMAAAAACKTSVSEFYATRGALPANLAESGCSDSASAQCAAPTVAAGVITIGAINDLNTLLTNRGSGTNLVFQPVVTTGAITDWNCDSTAGTTITDNLLPAECRP
jgi:type IV pilus assembly protein PilA